MNFLLTLLASAIVFIFLYFIKNNPSDLFSFETIISSIIFGGVIFLIQLFPRDKGE